MPKQTAEYMHATFSLDTDGSPISGVKLDPTCLYQTIPMYLQHYINEKDLDAWHQITTQIDTIYAHLDSALLLLDKETQCMQHIKSQINAGKKLFFKLNLVLPLTIDPLTHGAGAYLFLTTE